jgi:hypothetical protein
VIVESIHDDVGLKGLLLGMNFRRDGRKASGSAKGRAPDKDATQSRLSDASKPVTLRPTL